MCFAWPESESTKEHVANDIDTKKCEKKQAADEVNNEVIKEGYLKKQSSYLKKFRRRFIILRENHLFCYENDKKAKITEFIKLSLFERAILSEKELNQFKLKPKNTKKTSHIFAADSLEEAEEWINYLNCSMNVDNMTKSIENKQSAKNKEQGIMWN